MKYSSKTGNPIDIRTDCLVVTTKRARSLAKSLKISEFVEHAIEQSQSKVIALPIPSRIKNLIIVPSEDKLDEVQFKKHVNQTAALLRTMPIRDAVWCLNDINVVNRDNYWKTRSALVCLSSNLYWYDKHKSKRGNNKRISRIAVFTDRRSRSSVARAVHHGQALDGGLNIARDLGNEPANVCNPPFLVREVRKLSRNTKATVRVLDEKQMSELGMGAFMSVTKGSDVPGKMIIMQYKGGQRGDPPVVLIGKGITFDTGGISLKPGAAMDEMKFDMCGAASVIGATKAVLTAKIPINLVTIIAAAENMPSGKASRPSDVVTTMSGQTVEILNTDAEGRLVLCDALTYAERYKPKAVVDVATLTGACVVALGSHASALYANDNDLSKDLQSAGQLVQDRAWPMPLWDEYQQQLSSNFADMANVGGRQAGSITAACFLSRYATKFKWAHLDIAGTAWLSGTNKGATGRPVPLLFEYLVDSANA